MSIEKTLTRIADALEKITEVMIADSTNPNITSAAAPAAPVTAPAAAAAAFTQLSDVEMDQALVTEYNRLGGREGIDDIMAELAVTGVTGLSANVQEALLTAVRALPTPQ